MKHILEPIGLQILKYATLMKICGTIYNLQLQILLPKSEIPTDSLESWKTKFGKYIAISSIIIIYQIVFFYVFPSKSLVNFTSHT